MPALKRMVTIMWEKTVKLSLTPRRQNPTRLGQNHPAHAYSGHMLSFTLALLCAVSDFSKSCYSKTSAASRCRGLRTVACSTCCDALFIDATMSYLPETVSRH